MTEQEKLQRAKHYIDSLANGLNPLNGMPIPEQEVVNQIRISRCLFYVSEILRQQIEDHEKKPTEGKEKVPFHITEEELLRYVPSRTPIPASEISNRVNEILAGKGMRKVSYRKITTWLVAVGLMEEEEMTAGKYRKTPSASGIAMGITTEIRTGARGEYPCVVYDENAQEFILQNLNEIMNPPVR